MPICRVRELAVSAVIEKDEEMMQQIRQMEEAYDNELFQLGEGA